MKKTKIIIIVICVVSMAGFSLYLLTQPTVYEVMKDFHEANDRAEDMLIDPLILNAKLVKYRIIEDIKNPDMDKRRYAIAFLGNERIEESLPTLRNILKDPQEKDYFRADALESIYCLDKKEGLETAIIYKDGNDYLGRIAKEFLDGTYTTYQRTYFQAFFGVHE